MWKDLADSIDLSTITLLVSNKLSKIYSAKPLARKYDGHPEVIIKESKTGATESKLHKKASKRSPCVVEFLDSSINEGNRCIVMENCANDCLTALIRQREPEDRFWGTLTLKKYMHSLLTAVKAIHDIKIVHRDIKPDNIFVTQDLEVKLGDFGVSQFASPFSTLKGTFLYLPPELVCNNNSRIDLFKCDIWSLGKSFLEMCALTPCVDLHEYYDDEESLMRYVENVLREANKEIVSLIKSMLRLEPRNRPSVDEALGMVQFKDGDLPDLEESTDNSGGFKRNKIPYMKSCLLYTSDAADE